MALKKGICKNYDNCDLADNKEIQEVDSTEFKCTECGKDLHELDEGAGKTKGPGKDTGKKKLIGIIAAAVVVIGGGVGAALGLGGGKEEATDPVVVDTPTVVEPVAEPTVEPVVEPTVEPKVKPEPKPASTGGSGKFSLGYGSYSGPMQGDKPHGAGGTISVNRSYQIDLKDGNGGMLDINPGDKIVNTKFENGRLRSGELQRTDGTRKWFNC